MYDPYSRELDHLDKTVFLENRMRIQERIINRHRIDVDRSHDSRTKNANIRDPNDSKMSYSGMFTRQQNVKRSGSKNQIAQNMDNIWLPTEISNDFHGNLLDYTVPESLDTARGKAKYALVRLNSNGQPVIPHVYLENPNQVVVQPANDMKVYPEYYNNSNKQGQFYDTNGLYNRLPYETRDKRFTVNPNNFIGSENREILEKVNDVRGVPSGAQNSNQASSNDMGKKHENINNMKKKKNSQISLDLLKEDDDKKHPLLSRRSKQLTKVQNKKNNGDMDTLHSPEPEIKILAETSSNTEHKVRRLSRDTSKSYSRKSSTNNSRQSFHSLGKSQYFDKTPSFSSNHHTSPIPKLSHDKHNVRSKPEHGEKPNAKSKPEINVKSNEVRPPNESPLPTGLVTDKKHTTKKSHKLVRQREQDKVDISADDVMPNNKHSTGKTHKISEKNKESVKTNTQIHEKGKEKNKESTKTNTQIHEKSKEKNKESTKTNTQIHEKGKERANTNSQSRTASKNEKKLDVESKKSTKNVLKSNDKKPNYMDKHRALRKTESFKMMGNSSEFFGYCSVPEDADDKKLKSILKKPRTNPDRPDTA